MTDDAKSTSAAPSVPPEEGDDPASARAKPLPLRLPVVPQDSPAPALIPARMINEVLYCERLLYLEYVQGEWADNVYTADGQAVHRRARVGGEPGVRTAAPFGFAVSERPQSGEAHWS